MKKVSIHNLSRSNKKCGFCGNAWHDSLSACPARNITCKGCGRKGHFFRKCRNKNCIQHLEQRAGMNDGFSSDDCLYLETKTAIHHTSERRIDVTILGKRVSLQVDTGADRSVLSSTIWKSFGIATTKTVQRNL